MENMRISKDRNGVEEKLKNAWHPNTEELEHKNSYHRIIEINEEYVVSSR